MCVFLRIETREGLLWVRQWHEPCITPVIGTSRNISKLAGYNFLNTLADLMIKVIFWILVSNYNNINSQYSITTFTEPIISDQRSRFWRFGLVIISITAITVWHVLHENLKSKRREKCQDLKKGVFSTKISLFYQKALIQVPVP